jgi:DNA-binding NarL/FixJ family response regulator
VPDFLQSSPISTRYFVAEPSPAPPPDLAAAATALDERACTQTGLAPTWQELVQGYASVEVTFFSSTRCGVVLAAADPPATPPLAGRRLEIIESILAGASQNQVAIEMAVAASTVALHARLALESLGVPGRPSRVHPLLMLAATVSRQRISAAGSLSFMRVGERELRVIGIPRPDRCLVDILPTAEREVVGYLFEGCCYAEIAQRRRTAQRTIANQIAAVFKRLRVSGRAELVQRLFVLDNAVPPLPPASPAPQTPPTLPPTVRYPRPASLASPAALTAYAPERNAQQHEQPRHAAR